MSNPTLGQQDAGSERVAGKSGTESSDAGHGAPPSRLWQAIPPLLLLLGSLATTLQRFDRSMWQDEAWVANSVIASNLHNMFFYEAWAQTTPPLFLLLVRFLVEQVGLSDMTLKLLPLLFGLAAIAIFAFLAGKLLRVQFGFLATLLVAFSPLTIGNSQTLKQYSGELFAACLMLLLSWNYLCLPTRSRYWVLVGAGCLLVGLSYSLAMIFPVCLGCLLLADTSRKVKIFRISIFAVIFGLALACLYLFFVRPNNTASLQGFWAGNLPSGSWMNQLSFYFRNIVHVYSAALLPVSASRVLSETVSWAFTTLTAAGLILSFSSRNPTDRAFQFYLLAFLPLISLIGLSALGKYPMGAGRTQIFLLPCMALWLTYSAKVVWESLPIFRANFEGMSLARWTVLSTVVAVIVSVASAWTMRHREMGLWEDNAGALRSVRERLTPNDLLYVHASLTEPAKLYFAMWNWSPSHVVFGDTGAPCCRRVGDTRDIDSEQRLLIDAVKQAIERDSRARVWILATGRITLWGPLGRNDFDTMDLSLRQNGCSPDFSPTFQNVLLRRYKCQ